MNRNLVIASAITVAVIIGVVILNRNRKGMASTSRTTPKKKINIKPSLVNQLEINEPEEQDKLQES